MTIYIKDPVTDKAVRDLARIRGVTLTEAIRDAVQQALVEESAAHEHEDEASRDEKLRALQAELAKWPATGLKADKAFYDWLSGEED